jgi:Cupin superfamily protein
VTALAELIAPRGAEDFLGATRGREMEVFRGTRGRFGYLLPWPALNEILHCSRFEPVRLRLAKAGEIIPPDRYSSRLSPGQPYFRIRHDDMARQLNDGATLVLNSVDELYAPIPDGEPRAEFILDEGDLLHIPRGWWHHVTAVDEPSLHLTAGVTPATGADLIAWATDQLLRCEPIRQNLPVHASVDDQQRYVGRLTETLVRELGAAQAINRFRASRDALAPARSHVCLPWSATDDGLPPETDPCLRLTAPRAVLEDRDGTTELAADGHVYRFAAQARPVLRTLLDGAPHRLSELSAASDGSSPEAIRILCADLIRAGVVTVRTSLPRAEACR